jgi:hypothetical protein
MILGHGAHQYIKPPLAQFRLDLDKLERTGAAPHGYCPLRR